MPIDFNAALKGKADEDSHAGENFPSVFEVAPLDQPQVYAPLDLTPVKESLAQYEPQIVKMETAAMAIEVTDGPSQAAAVELAGQAKQINKAIEVARKGFVHEPGQFVAAVNSLARGFRERFESIESGLKVKIGRFDQQQELERRKAEAKAQEEARKLQERLDKEAAVAGVESVKLESPVMPKRDAVVRTASGSASTKKVWTFEVKDPEKVPREYLTVDEKAIRQAVNGGVRDIPGVKIFQGIQVAIR